MATATHPSPGFIAPGTSGPLLTSVLIHVVLLTALVVSFERGSSFQVPPGALAIQAVVVDKSQLDKAMRRTQVADPEIARRQQAERDRQAQIEQQAQAQREQEAREAREAEEARQAVVAREAEEARQAEVKRKAEEARKAEAARKAEEARQAEVARKAEQTRKAEAARKAQAERKAVQAREAAAAQARQKDAARQAAIRSEIAANERALMAQMQEEEAYMSAASSGLLDEYVALIRQKVERNWLKPPGATADLDCEVRVTQIPGGEVVDVRIVRCNGDAAVLQSIERAVYSASPLPLPSDPSLFDRNLTFVFDPEE